MVMVPRKTAISFVVFCVAFALQEKEFSKPSPPGFAKPEAPQKPLDDKHSNINALPATARSGAGAKRAYHDA